MRFDRLLTLDVHSAVAAQLMDRLVNVRPEPLILQAITRFAQRIGSNGVTVLFPDEGAATRYDLPDRYGCNVDEVSIQKLYCTKDRDSATGKLLGFNVPHASKFRHPAVIIVDDICDGGGTFLGIAGKLDRTDLGLYVTHGIFSKGFDELHAWFQRIYFTDSFGIERGDKDVHTIGCGPLIRAAIR
jgi:ribose-phosphate pyrophosphokinase